MKRSILIGLILGQSLGSALVYAQSDMDFEMMDLEDDAYDLEDLDVDGTAKKRPTVSDRMKKIRDRMEQKTEDRVLKKIEDTRMKEELKLTKKLQNMFNGQAIDLDKEDQVDLVTQSAAATQTNNVVVEVAPTAAPVEAETFKKVKITPQFGVTGMQTDSFQDFESTFTTGLSIDSRLHERFSVGIGFSYSKMTIKDYTNAQNPYYGGGVSPYMATWPYSYSPYSYSPYYGDYSSWYGSNYGIREIDSTSWSVDLNGKFYIIGTGVIQPYLGAGIGYNRTKLKYEDSNGQTYMGAYTPYSNVQFGNEAYTGSFVSGQLLAGTDIMFTDMFGLNLQFKYSKGLSSQSDQGQGIIANPDQLFLNQLGQEIDEASQATISAGINVAF